MPLSPCCFENASRVVLRGPGGGHPCLLFREAQLIYLNRADPAELNVPGTGLGDEQVGLEETGWISKPELAGDEHKCRRLPDVIGFPSWLQVDDSAIVSLLWWVCSYILAGSFCTAPRCLHFSSPTLYLTYCIWANNAASSKAFGRVCVTLRLQLLLLIVEA